MSEQSSEQPKKKCVKIVLPDEPIKPVRAGRPTTRKPKNHNYKNHTNSKIQIWNKVVKENGYMTGGKRMPRKSTKEYLAIRKIYDELVASMNKLAPKEETAAPPTSPNESS